MASWIWLDPERYPTRQKSRFTGTWDNKVEGDTVVELSRTFASGKEISKIELIYSADALAQLWINGRFLGTGPVMVGGDFLANDRPRENRYHTAMTLVQSGDDDYICRVLTVPSLDVGEVKILARVRLNPVQINEFSIGRGGFMLYAKVYFDDGSTEVIETDGGWDATLCPAYYTPAAYDGEQKKIPAGKASVTPDVWNTTLSPLPLRVEHRLEPKGGKITVGAHETCEALLEFDKIYAGYLSVKASSCGTVKVDLSCMETEEDTGGKSEQLTLVREDEYLGTVMYSLGLIRAKITNCTDSEAVLDIAINEAYLPSSADAATVTSLPWLNQVLEVCKHTLKYCRQYIHLDSPKHCEPSACTGDYFIETMMTSYSFGDMTLADFDVVRTARLLEHNDGIMFHPTYSLIWVRMLLEIYKRCGREGLLADCKRALGLLLDKFRSYIGENGLIETPPSFMFVDWIFIDGISMHHPPKALGQSVMNMFFYDALRAAAEIYSYLGDGEQKSRCTAEADALRTSINTLLFDHERGLYFEGLNTATPKELIGGYMPENTDKRYYRINSNALAAAFGVIEGDAAVCLMRRVLDDGAFDDYQPYFAHFVLQAVHCTGLDGEYLLPLLEKWRAPVEHCPKGLAEGFIPPEPTYIFDHSHAWGGTPLYSLPTALTSLEILEPGMGHISLTPRLLGLDHATVEIPTPHGIVTLEMKKGKAPTVTSPEGVTVDIIEK